MEGRQLRLLNSAIDLLLVTKIHTVCVEVCGVSPSQFARHREGGAVTDQCNVQSAAFRGASSVHMLCTLAEVQVWVSHSDNIQ